MMPVKVAAVAGSRGRSSRRRRPLETTETEHVFPRQRRVVHAVPCYSPWL